METTLRSDRRKNPEKVSYRFLTFGEIANLHAMGQFSRADCLDHNGKICQVTITSVKKWKTSAFPVRTSVPEIEIRWKFGLHESGKEVIFPNESQSFFVEIV